MQPGARFFTYKWLLFLPVLFSGGGLLLADLPVPEKKPAIKFNAPVLNLVPPPVTFTTRAIAPNATLFERNLPPAFVLPANTDLVARRLLKDNGAVFVAQGRVVHPLKVIFTDQADCADWQSGILTRRQKVSGILIELQAEAMQALLAAQKEAAGKNLTLTPRGTWAARRTYQDTEKIWRRRVTPGLDYWRRRGKLSAGEAARIRSLAPAQQVNHILKLEARGLFFSKDFSKSILYSGTAPGASQHIAMLALDIKENQNAALRAILARHGWFQTVISDLPHFTYLGTTQDNLPALGLKKTVKQKRVYWTPSNKEIST